MENNALNPGNFTQGVEHGRKLEQSDIIKLIEGLTIKNEHFPESYHTEGYNKAISDILKLIKA